LCAFLHKLDYALLNQAIQERAGAADFHVEQSCGGTDAEKEGLVSGHALQVVAHGNELLQLGAGELCGLLRWRLLGRALRGDLKHVASKGVFHSLARIQEQEQVFLEFGIQREPALALRCTPPNRKRRLEFALGQSRSMERLEGFNRSGQIEMAVF